MLDGLRDRSPERGMKVTLNTPTKFQEVHSPLAVRLNNDESLEKEQFQMFIS